MFKAFVISFFLAILKAAKPDEVCCETFETELEKEWLAYHTLCSGEPKFEDCCDKVKSDLENKTNAMKVLCPVSCSTYSILFNRRSTSDYVISTGAPPMTAITACFWLNTTQKVGRPHFVSYAVPGTDNEFLIYGKPFGFMVKGVEPKSKTGVINPDGKWHSICVTWSSQNGGYKAYKDGKMILEGGNLKKGQTITGGGTWVLGQDQDRVGGGFNAQQMVQGEMAQADIWNKVLTEKEILESSSSCKSDLKGNVKSWSDFKSGVRGNVIIKDNPSCCKA